MYDKKNDIEKNIPFGSFELLKEKVKHLENNSKLPKDKSTTYEHSKELIGVAKGKKASSAGGNNFELTTGIMKYVTKTKMPESMQEDIKNRLNDINNNKEHDNIMNVINDNEPENKADKNQLKKTKKGQKKNRHLDY